MNQQSLVFIAVTVDFGTYSARTFPRQLHRMLQAVLFIFLFDLN